MFSYSSVSFTNNDTCNESGFVCSSWGEPQCIGSTPLPCSFWVTGKWLRRLMLQWVSVFGLFSLLLYSLLNYVFSPLSFSNRQVAHQLLNTTSSTKTKDVSLFFHQETVGVCFRFEEESAVSKYLCSVRPSKRLHGHIQTFQQHLPPHFIFIHQCLVYGLNFFLTSRIKSYSPPQSFTVAFYFYIIFQCLPGAQVPGASSVKVLLCDLVGLGLWLLSAAKDENIQSIHSNMLN